MYYLNGLSDLLLFAFLMNMSSGQRRGVASVHQFHPQKPMEEGESRAHSAFTGSLSSHRFRYADDIGVTKLSQRNSPEKYSQTHLQRR